MFSVVIPAYHAPAYLALCLRSILEGQSLDNEIIVVFDGCFDDYQQVYQDYHSQIQCLILPQNEGLCQALNKGVWQARFDKLLLINEDNVLPLDWDRRLLLDYAEDRVVTVNQIEPLPDSVYGFVYRDWGQSVAQFDLAQFQAAEPALAKTPLLSDGRTFPMALSKRHYLQVGGFDTIYPSPHYCDFDFFLKLELSGQLEFVRSQKLHVYHFGQKSTTRPDGSPAEQAQAAEHFKALAEQARAIYEHKWGIAALRGPDHSLMPRVRLQNGIRYQQRHEDLKLATVVNFCSNELRFIDACLTEALTFSSQLIVPVCDHFFDGQPEDLGLIEALIQRYPEVRFVGFAYQHQPPRPPWYWPSLARVVAYRHLDPDLDWVLWLDADEIVDGEAMLQLLQTGQHLGYAAQSFSNYWYFREACFQAETLEDSAILIRRDQISESSIMDPMERISLFEGAQGHKRRFVNGLDQIPLVHHYSWVRSQAQMLRKVRAWSHREDRDWEACVQQEFQGPFKGTDFVHGYTFKTVSARFDL